MMITDDESGSVEFVFFSVGFGGGAEAEAERAVAAAAEACHDATCHF